MPEGPSIILVKEAVTKFIGKKIIAVSGNSIINQDLVLNQNVIDFKSWGKHFLICFKGFTLRVNFLKYGSYTVDEKKLEGAIKLKLTFKNGE